MSILDILEDAAAQRPYQLLTSTRYDLLLETYSWNNDAEGSSRFFLLPLHFDRLVSAAETHNWFYAKTSLKYHLLKSACMDAISEQRIRGKISDAFKLRITLSKEGRVVVTATPVSAFTADPTSVSSLDLIINEDAQSPRPINIYLDIQSTKPSVFTLTKTTLREVYEQTKARNATILESSPAGYNSDILMYNADGQIMEATIFNVAFYRGSSWLTPPTRSGCLPGVMRKWLIQNDRIREDHSDTLTKDSIQDGERVLLFNGVQGCRLGRLCR